MTLIEKMLGVLKELDGYAFPTDSSVSARELLVNTLETIKDPSNLSPMEPSVLHNRLFLIQRLIDLVKNSTTDHISWPFVSYCDKLWRLFFPQGTRTIFYSVTPEHNYKILRFSRRLSRLLSPILASSTVNTLINGPHMYCLQLAYSEEENLPLYANIGHEFGHAVFDEKGSAVVAILNQKINPVLQQISTSLFSSNPTQASRLFDIVKAAIIRIASELFADLVGATIMGPAFFLSMFEISWGQNKDSWKVVLSPDIRRIRAYPSYNFRLSSIKQLLDIDKFCSDAQKDFSTLENLRLRELANCLDTILIDHDHDSIKVSPPLNPDSGPVRAVLNSNLSQAKTALEEFVLACGNQIKQWYPVEDICATTDEISKLLERLDRDILPNIIPDKTLLGSPATFNAILTASALFRVQLATNSSVDRNELPRKMRIAERLTAKALEVSFVQEEYNKRDLE